MSPIIELRGLTNAFGHNRAVDDLTCTIEPGVVTLPVFVINRRDL